jgi:cation-transporting ATPase 13A3/4/5
VRSLHSDDDAIETDHEDWGYTSGEEDEYEPERANDDDSMVQSIEYDSRPPSPNASFPLLTSDPVFGGDARIDMGTSFDDLDPPPPGPPSRQAIYIADEDMTIRLVGYECLRSRLYLWRAGCFVTFGILALLGHWFPRLWLRCVAREKAFVDAENGFVVVDVSCTDSLTICYRQRL